MLQKQEILSYLANIKPKLKTDGIVKLGLFGSYAKDRADELSDVDIVLQSTDIFVDKFEGFSGLYYLEKLREQIKSDLGVEVDICDTATMPLDRQKRLLNGVIYV